VVESEHLVAQERQRVESAIRGWLSQHDMEDDVCFRSWVEHYDDEPRDWPDLCVMCVEGDACRVANLDHPLSDSFYEHINSLGYVFELDSVTNGCLWHRDEEQAELYLAIQEVSRWEWVQRILAPTYADVYAETTEYFAQHSDRLQLLQWRQFEELLHTIFRNNGFRSELGPGGNDGGVDHRLYSNDVFPEVLTLVQAKRYAPHRPIGLESVQALFGAVTSEGADNGLFVTTSRFLPSSHRFADKECRSLRLAGPEEVACWASFAAERIRSAQAIASDVHAVRALLERPIEISLDNLVGRILVCSPHGSMLRHQFAVVVKHAGKAILMVTLPSKRLPKDTSTGIQEPDVLIGGHTDHRSLRVIRARRTGADPTSYWGGRELWSVWNGQSMHFDFND